MTLRYTDSQYLKGGSFGVVSKCTDTKTKKVVAIKDIEFRDGISDQYKRVFREIAILSYLKSAYSIHLLDVYQDIDSSNGNLLKVSLVLPFMDFDLREVIENYVLEFPQILKVVYQLLLGLKYLCYCGILHRDLKPSNIGLSTDLSLRILDYGLARDKNDDMTNYVVTRWYRPIEVFCTQNYTTAIDMWSTGCIVYELLTGNVLFKGSSQLDQVKNIISVMGMPDEDFFNSLENENIVHGLRLFKDFAAETCQLKKTVQENIKRFFEDEQKMYCDSMPDVLTLICQMLDLNPDKRIVPSKALHSSLFIKHKDIIGCYVEDSIPNEYYSELNQSRPEGWWKDRIIQLVRKFHAQ